MRGYFTALVLAELERRLGVRCSKVFDLIAGTSIGGILAVGLAHGIRAETLAAMIREHGPRIFPRRPLTLLRRFAGPPYKPGHLEAAIRGILGAKSEQPLSRTSVPVMVVAVAPTTARLLLPSSWDMEDTAGMTALDACMATSAAPSYFPAHRAAWGGRPGAVDLIDGGIAANAPDALAVDHASSHLGVPPNRMAMLSVGTGGPRPGGVGMADPAALGLTATLLSLGGRGIVNLAMAVQEGRGVSEARSRLGDASYLRLDGSPSSEQSRLLSLDNSSPEALRTMEEMASPVGAEIAASGSHGVWRHLLARAAASRQLEQLPE